MSYDIWVEIPCKNENNEDSWESISSHNYTFNVSTMFYKAFEKSGGNWKSFHDYESINKTCKEAIPELVNAITEMENNKEEYERLNPENGWGDYEGALEFLKKILKDCKKFPYGRIGVWV
jgi:hypothetical protein